MDRIHCRVFGIMLLALLALVSCSQAVIGPAREALTSRTGTQTRTGRWVAVGLNGSVAWSDDGIAWTLTNAGTQNLFGVTYGDQGFVAVGTAGTIFVSSTAEAGTWTQVTMPPTYNLNAITHGNGVYAAVGFDSVGPDPLVLWSTNAVSWTDEFGTVPETLADVAFGTTGFLAIGSNQFHMYSLNGSTWFEFAEPTPTLSYGAIAFGSGLFLIDAQTGVLGTVTSLGDPVTFPGPPDGVYTPSASIEAMAHSAQLGRFLLGGDDGEFYTTEDGLAITNQGAPTGGTITGIATDGSRVVLAADAGELLWTDDTTTWTFSSQTLGASSWRDIIYAETFTAP